MWMAERRSTVYPSSPLIHRTILLKTWYAKTPSSFEWDHQTTGSDWIVGSDSDKVNVALRFGFVYMCFQQEGFDCGAPLSTDFIGNKSFF